MANEKINKEFCLTDDSVNVYGYRLLTAGLLLERFKPAIGFLMHNREKGVAVKWTDFRTDGDKLYAKPTVNTKLFPDLAEQIEAGFYDAASIGKIVALELSDDENLKIDGQTGPTVTKWFPREASIVDIPGNYNAIAQLYDELDNVIRDLSDNKNNKNQNQISMNKLELTAEQIAQLNLKDDATPEQLGEVLNDLVEKAGKAEAAEKALADLKAETAKKEIEAILEKGQAERKLTKELADTLAEDYKGNPEGLKKVVDSMPVQNLVSTTGDVPEEFKGKTFGELYAAGKLEDLKAKYPDYYQQLKEGGK